MMRSYSCALNKLVLFAIAIVLGMSFSAHGVTYFVKAGGTGTGTTSFSNASGDLQAMINLAETTPTTPDEIWVAAGEYFPTQEFIPGTPRSKTFRFSEPNLKVYGGFVGLDSEVEVSQRNPTANLTILSGDLDGNDDDDPPVFTDNAYHVVTFDPGDVVCHFESCGVGTGNCWSLPNALTDTTKLDGFVVTKGHASSPVQRESLGPVELARALLEQLERNPRIKTRDDLSHMLGKDKAWISRTLSILRLPEELQTKVATSRASSTLVN